MVYCVDMSSEIKTSAKILIVDDEVLVTKTLKTLLNIEGYSGIETFNNPKKALEFLKLEQVDLIISDFIMPELNGLEFLNQAKKIHQNCTQILLTGYADKENAIRAINELGIFKYIEKPWNNADLLNNIKNGIERTQLKKQLEIKIEELEIANSQLIDYSKTLEDKVTQKTRDLSEMNLKLNAIFDNCADGIIIFDDELKIMFTNTACQNLFGLENEQLVRKNFFELLINEKNQKIYDKIQDKKPVYLRDFSLIDYKNELKVPVEINIAPVFNEIHNFFVGVIRDVSYQKENERLRDDFIATLTHDLRTPLLAAISGLEFILNGTLGDLSEKQNLILDTMKKSNEDMLGLVNALLEVYRYESGKLFLCKTQFCVNNLIKKCAKELEPLIQDKKIIFNFENDKKSKGDEFIINADINEIRRVIVNLISNAIKHSENSSKITITTIGDGKDVQIFVKDNGIGLSEADCQKLFKRFSQGTSHKRTCSTGLGLYLSRQIVEAHNGKIWVESEIGKGSEFKFLLKNAITENRVLI